MKRLLKPGERLDDLQFDGLMLIQNPEYYTFTSDSVLLANYEKYRGKVCELCAGSGVISLLVSAKCKVESIDTVEIQPEMVDMARRSVVGNAKQDVITVHEGDVKCADQILGCEKYDVVLVNPPYMKAGGGEENLSRSRAIARHEILLTFEDISCVLAKILKYGGSAYIVHRADRVAEVISRLAARGLETKRLTFFGAKGGIDRVIVKATKGGKPGVKVEWCQE